MKTLTRKTVLTLCASAVALSAAVATPALAMGDGASWRYDRHLEREAETMRMTSATSQGQGRGDQQFAIGTTVFSDVGPSSGNVQYRSKDPKLSNDINYLDHPQYQRR